MSLSTLIEVELDAMKRIEEAKNKAKKIIEDAKKRASEIVNRNRIMQQVDKYVSEEEKKLREEAKRIYESYLKEIEATRNIPLSKINEISDIIVREVMGVE